MRYSLLNFIECPISKTELTCVVLEEKPCVVGHIRMRESGRVNQPGAMFGPAPKFKQRTWLTEFLEKNACAPAPDARNYEVAVEEGLLISAESGRWYPIKRAIPEILPDHLRDVASDLAFLARYKDRLPEALFARLNDPRIFSGAAAKEDSGSNYKRSEMSISSKVEDPLFFGPGYIAPFNPGARDHTAYLIRLFSFCLPLLSQDGADKVVLDAGCGYAWTTDWLFKIGFEPIGVDITRTYLDIAAHRLGPWLPHVLQADTENLPLKPEILDGILCYEAFHHIPNRNKAMSGFFRALRAGKQVVLAEPGGAHEAAAVSVDAMQKYGILERGMELSDVAGYTAGTGFRAPRQHRVIELAESELNDGAWTKDRLLKRSFTNSNLYTVQKPAR